MLTGSSKARLIPILLVTLIAVVVGVGGMLLVTQAPVPPQEKSLISPDPKGDLEAAVHQLGRVTESLSERLDDLAMQVSALNGRASAPTRTPIEAPRVEQTPEAKEFLAALSEEAAVPPGFDAWFAQTLQAKEERDREVQRIAREETIAEMVDERMEDLTKTLNLAPYQTDEVRNILTNQASVASAIWSDSSNRLEAIRSMGPLRDKTNEEMKAILAPEQFTTYTESSTNGPPFGPIRSRGRE